jgi:hypothetical protein
MVSNWSAPKARVMMRSTNKNKKNMGLEYLGYLEYAFWNSILPLIIGIAIGIITTVLFA